MFVLVLQRWWVGWNEMGGTRLFVSYGGCSSLESKFARIGVKREQLFQVHQSGGGMDSRILISVWGEKKVLTATFLLSFLALGFVWYLRTLRELLALVYEKHAHSC